MSRFIRLVVCLACLVSFANDASAGIIINIQQVGGNVVASTTGGTLNVSGLTLGSQSAFIGSIGEDELFVGSGIGKIYSGSITISAPFAPGLSGVGTLSNSGFVVGFALTDAFDYLVLPRDAVLSSGSYTLEAASSTFDSQTLSSLNLTPGSYTVSWGSNGSSDSIIVNVGSTEAVPEPTSAAIAGFLFAASAVRLRKRRIAR